MATVTEEAPPDAPPAVEPEGLYEVIDGRIVETPPMGAYETWIASWLALAMGPFAGGDRPGAVVVEMLFVIDPARGLKRRPDVAFVSGERWARDRPIPRGPAAWEIVPDLAVEIVSPTNFADEIVDKIAEYFHAGTRLVWVLYPSQNLVYSYDSPRSVRILGVGDDLDGGATLPGFRTPVTALFGVDSGQGN